MTKWAVHLPIEPSHPLRSFLNDPEFFIHLHPAPSIPLPDDFPKNIVSYLKNYQTVADSYMRSCDLHHQVLEAFASRQPLLSIHLLPRRPREILRQQRIHYKTLSRKHRSLLQAAVAVHTQAIRPHLGNSRDLRV
jgi:hypothetical protein